jgi:UDP-glucuronate 4-epimerase
VQFLITGTAGFIGFHLARRLLGMGHSVAGIDGMTPYYDVSLKEHRHALLGRQPGFKAHRVMLEDAAGLRAVFHEARPDVLVHLAAQAGVRYSLENPSAYIDSNIVGTFNIVELCRSVPVKHLVMASTSSVYGSNPEEIFAETDHADHPMTLYAATKRATELIAHSYSHLWKIPTTMFRFFTVYGPWGRPDMALFKFVKNILADEPIDIYNHGMMGRDFTYVDDLVEGIVRLIDAVPAIGQSAGPMDSLSPVAPFRVVNIGGGQTVQLLDFIEQIEAAVGKKAIRNYLDMQPGDVPTTTASPALLEALTAYKPETPVSVGVPAFVDWYRDYYKA